MLGTLTVIALRLTALHVAALACLVALQPVRVCAQWWHRAPADYEECAEAAEKSATSEQKNPALAECNAKFAGRQVHPGWQLHDRGLFDPEGGRHQCHRHRQALQGPRSPGIGAHGALERHSFMSNRHRALVYCLSMIFFGKPVSTFPDHALAAVVALGLARLRAEQLLFQIVDGFRQMRPLAGQ